MIYFLSFLISYFAVDILILIFNKLYGYFSKEKEDTQGKYLMIVCSSGLLLAIAIIMIIILGYNSKTLGIILGCTIVLLINIIHDTYRAKGKRITVYSKIASKILPSVFVALIGTRIYGVTNPLTNDYLSFPIWVQFFSTIIWIVSIIYVINTLNKVRGLAAGITSISSLTLFIIGLVMDEPFPALLSLILCGISLGILKHDKHSTIAIGSNISSSFFGLILSIIAIEGAFKYATVLTLVIPFLAVGFPIRNGFSNILDRIKKDRKGDSKNISYLHRFIEENETNQQQKAAFLYMISIIISFTSIVLLLIESKL